MIPEAAPAAAVRTARVSDDGAIDLLRRVVEIPSLSGHESAAAEFLVSRMRSLGMRARLDEAGNAVGSVGPGGAPHVIVLLGHMDTVPGDIPVRLEGDILHGRGTVDAKGPLATFIVAAANADLPPDVRIDVIGAVEEESATSRGARHIARGPAPSACIIGEPSGWNGVTLGYKGRLLVDFTARQSSAHSAGPNPSATDRAVAWWSSVLNWTASRNAGTERAFDRVQATIRSMRSTSDGLEDRAELTASFRLPPTVTPHDVESACRAAIGNHGMLPDTMVVRGPECAHVADRSNAVARSLSGAIRAHAGTPTLKVKTGTSDMNVVGPVWNCPIAAYGPGDSALDHTPHEHISIPEYLTACRVLRDAVERLSRELVISR